MTQAQAQGDGVPAGGPGRRPRLPAGRTDWRRAGALLVSGTVLIGVLGTAMAEGALAASVGVSGNHFLVTADSVQGDTVVAYPDTTTTAQGKAEQSVLLGFKTGRITNLCLSSTADLPLLGPVALTLKSGSQGDVTVADFVASAGSVDGTDGNLSTFAVGVDASTLTPVEGHQGPPGRFGIGAQSLSLRNFRSTASAVTGGQFHLAGLHLGLRPGAGDGC